MKIAWLVVGFILGVASQNEQVADKALELGKATRCAVLDCGT